MMKQQKTLGDVAKRVLLNAMRFLLLPLLGASCLTLSAQDVDGTRELALGDQCYEQKKYQEAFEHYTKASETGNAQAQYLVGSAYYTGEGTYRDYASAVTWFKRAAKKNHAKAQYNLAYCYMYGRGVPRNYDRAFELLMQSAQNQLAEAQFTLAELYEKGVLVEQNAQEAKKWKDMAVVSAKRQKENANSSPVGELEGTANANANSNAQKVGTPVQNVLMGPKALKEQEKKAKKEDVKAKKEEAQVKSENQTPKNISPTPVPNTVSPTPAPNNITPTNIENKSPVIKILFPEDQSKFHEKTLNVKYKLTAYGEEKNTEVIVMVDGMVQKPSTSTSRSVRAAETVEVQLPDHDCVVTLYAKNRYGNSEPSSIRLIKENSLTEMPKLYVVAIGIGDYDDEKLPDLKFTHKDAADFSKAIAKKRGLPYEEVQVKTLCDDEATQGDIFEALSWLKEVSSPSDVCIFYYAGHGYRDEKDRFFFVPYGAHVDKDWECVSAQSFRDKANEIDGKFIVFLDACYSAALLNGSRSAVTDHFLEQLRSAKNGMMLYASSESDTKSKEDPEWQNGAYTHVLVDALNGAAKEDGDEGLSTDKLDKFLYNKVKEITKGTQKPIWVCPNGTQRFNLFIYDK